MKQYLLVLSLLFTIPALGQTLQLSGVVIDDSDKLPLPGATVMVTKVSDSVRVVTITNTAGAFKIARGPGHYFIKITFLGYLPYLKTITLTDKDLALGNLPLTINSKTLSEVKIEGRVPAVVQKGDTTEFNSAAYKINPDANADDLLEKLPGVVIDEGKVQVQGENVRKVLVDGKTFFGDDAIATLKNLPAEIIDKVQIYDEISEEARLSGIDDGEMNKTINIVTKPNMRNGTFGKVYAGIGNDDRYNTGVNLNQFKGDRRLTILGQSNTINQQNFASVDLLGVMGGGGGGRRREARSGGDNNRNNRNSSNGGSRGGGGSNRGTSDFLVPEMGGITQTHAIGLNYTDRWTNKIKVSGSYFGNYTSNKGFENSFRRYIDDSVKIDNMLDWETANSQNTNHRANFRFEYDIDSVNTFFMEPSLTFQFNNGVSDSRTESFYQDKLITESTNNSNSELLAYSFSNQLLLRHQFPKRGRSASVGIRMSANNNGGEEYFLADTRRYRRRNTIDLDNQFKTLDMGGWSLSPSLSYNEPLTRTSQLNFSYRGNIARNNSEKLTRDYIEAEDDYTGLDTLLSNTFYNNNFSHQLGLGYQVRYKKFNFSARGSYQYSELENEREYPSYRYANRGFHNLVPNLSLRYTISKQKNLRLLYFGNTNNPSIDQLQNVLNNANPLQLRIGNPDLKQFYRHIATWQYTATNPNNYSNFHAGFTGTLTQNQVTINRIFNSNRDTIYVANIPVAPDVQLIRPVNLNGGQNLRTFMSYGLPVKAIKTNVNFDISADYGRSPGIFNNVSNFSYTQNYGFGITLSSNISENLDFTLSSRSNYNLTSNTLNTNQNTNFFDQRNRVRLNYIFWKDLVFQTDFTQRLNTGLADGFNQNRALWNLSLGKKFLKKNAGDLRFTVFDALNQNNSINRRINNSYIEDTETQVLQRYYMLTFTYNIRKFGPGGPVKGQGKGNGGQRDRDKSTKKEGRRNQMMDDDF